MFEICIEGNNLDWLVVEINESNILTQKVENESRGRGGKCGKLEIILIKNLSGAELESICTFLKAYDGIPQHGGYRFNIEIRF